jgi:GxxExxY protein
VRFVLLTASAGAPSSRIACRLDVDDPSVLESAGDLCDEHPEWFPLQLTPDVLARISGSDLAVPLLRTSADLAIAERAAALFPPLGDAAGGRAAFGRELNATDDRAAFKPAGHRGALPIVEGKHLEPFHALIGATSHSIPPADARRLLPSAPFDRARLAYRDVASATNRTTLIAAILPPRTVSTHTVFCLRTPLPLRAQFFLCGLFNSLVVNYLVRMRVTTHVTTAIVERLPIPLMTTAPAAAREIAALARLLARRGLPHSAALRRRDLRPPQRPRCGALPTLARRFPARARHVSVDPARTATPCVDVVCLDTEVMEDTKVEGKPQRHEDTELERTNLITNRVIGCAIEVHRVLRAGLFESVYRSALSIEFDLCGLRYKREVNVPALYKGRALGRYRIDFVIEDLVIVEVKSVERHNPVFETQILTYLGLTGKRVGLLINFNTRLVRDGIKRFIR